MRDPTSVVVARRLARIVFGAVLFIGAAVLALRSAHDHDAGAAHALATTWAVAIGGWALVRLVVPITTRGAPAHDACLTESLVVPAVGLALVLPLTVHGLWGLLVGWHARDFDEWCGLAVRAVGFAHVVFALLFAVHARQLSTTERPGVSIAAIYGWTVMASTVPFGMWILPEAITAITGLPILIVLHVFDQIALRERTALPALPRAIVQPCRA
ncbi:MAG: hypothetical protein JO257_28355 [Deltaproteobacteria bacterium]|nr:hypothetical protein [Deltaproteobacteria bacterium]